MEADVGNDIITSLRSDLAGLQYKRDKLISEVRTKKYFIGLFIKPFSIVYK